jgi:CBS-domain-containing membrane protein
MKPSTLLHSPDRPLVFNDPDAEPQRVSGRDPAISVMTDLRLGPISVTTHDSSISDALATMKDAGVRFLFVLDETRRLIGSISSYDIQGEKPLLFMQSSSGERGWRDVQVRDVMEPVASWQVLDYADVRRLWVEDLVPLLEYAGKHHLVVVENTRAGRTQVVRGIISASRVQRLLGASVEIEPLATTFAEIEKRIA